jgi:predicted TIM-barrel fold metal-dependent hydrolase
MIKELYKYKETKYKKIIDCCIWYGVHYLNEELSFGIKDIEQAVKIFGQYSLEANLILSSYQSLFHDPLEGDCELESIIYESKHLSGVLIFPNSFITDYSKFKKYLTKKYKNRFKILRLCPKTHKYLIDPIFFDKVYKMLNGYNFPVIINLEELDLTGNKAINWKLLYDVHSKYPNIPIIIDGGNSKELMFNGYFYQLLENTDNIFIESHNLLGFDQLEDIVNKFGSQRLVFGSYLPHYSGHLSINRILYSRLTDTEKENILYKNMEKIFEGINFR